MRRVLVALAILATAAVAYAEDASAADDDTCIALSSVTSLSLQPGMTMTRRRTANVPTLNCAGNCPTNAFLAGAQCTQTGVSDNGLPSWQCKGSFPGATRQERFSLGQVRVQCEGCKKAGDSRVVKGSCALTYSVQTQHRGYRRRGYHGSDREEMTTGDFVMLFIIIGSLVACCYFAAKRRRSSEYAYEGVPVGPDGKPVQGGVHHHHHGGGGYGGGGGGFGTGMFTGFLMGDMMGRMSANSYGGGGYGGGGGYDDDFGGGGGGGSWGGGDGGFGGMDSV
jgi:hypothetical protein